MQKSYSCTIVRHCLYNHIALPVPANSSLAQAGILFPKGSFTKMYAGNQSTAKTQNITPGAAYSIKGV